MHVFQVPKRLTFETASSFGCELLESPPEEDQYVLDFSEVGRFEPFALLYLGSEIQRFKKRFSGATLSVRNHEHMGYAHHMGFFSSIEIGEPKNNSASGSNRYIPIRIINVEKLVRNALIEGREVGDLIEDSCEEIAQVLARTDSGPLFDTLVYSFREIMRNVAEHSNATQFGFCAQYWPKYNKVEAAFLDRGDGIRKSLSRNPNITITNDHEALNYSLMPGISGKAYKGAPKQRGVWANSGYGLYMTSRLARQGGSFFIASGDTGMYLSEEKHRHLKTPFKGVALNLSFNVTRLSDLKASLGRLRDEASQIAGKFKYGKNLDASVASTMLRRDFKN